MNTIDQNVSFSASAPEHSSTVARPDWLTAMETGGLISTGDAAPLVGRRRFPGQAPPLEARQVPEAQQVTEALARATRVVETLEKRRSGTSGSSAFQRVSSPTVLHPEARAGAASLEQRLIERASMGWNLATQAQVDAMGWRNYLGQQLEPEQLDNSALEDALFENLPSLSLDPLERLLAYEGQLVLLYLELVFATYFRALYSTSQLEERLVTLWNDHFHTSISADFGLFLKSDYEHDTIRRHAMGTFSELLRATAHSPAMLDFLTNDSNVAGNPNENYARELMELHTLGADAGYTQEDVREVARCFTGWTFFDPRRGPESFGRFLFLPRNHDDGQKIVLGNTISAGGGVSDGDQVVDILAAHPNTARFVARKLLVHFWGYVPNERTVDAVAEVFSSSGGDIRTVTRRVLSWYDLAESTPKLKRPFHLVVSSIRALFAGINDLTPLVVSVFAAGHSPFFWGPPNGYPDAEGYWAGLILPRWNYSFDVIARGLGLDVDLTWFLESSSPEDLVARIDLIFFGGTLSDSSRAALVGFAAGRPLDRATIGETVGLATASPEFQYY